MAEHGDKIWLSCVVRKKNVSTAKKKCFLEANLDELISDLVSKLDIQDGEAIKIYCSAHEQADVRDMSEVQLNTPIKVIHSFNVKFIVIMIQENESPSLEHEQEKSVFSVLPELKPTYRADYRLFNSIVEKLKEMDIMFTNFNVVSTGKKVVETITASLWYTNQHGAWEKFKERGCEIPQFFHPFRDYYDFTAAHKALRKISANELKHHADQLAELLMMPWFAAHPKLYEPVDGLCKVLVKYHRFLTGMQKRAASRHTSEEPLRNPESNFELRTILPVQQVDVTYVQLDEVLKEQNVYDPIVLRDILPEDRCERRNWIKQIAISVPIALYTYHHGNYLGNINVVWRLPDTETECTETKTFKVIEVLHSDVIPKYSTRCIRRKFFERYAKVRELSPAILREMYRHLTGDESSAESTDQAEVDTRMQYFLNTDDVAVIVDLRKNNGKPDSTRFNMFWDEMTKYFEEKTLAVHERRHSEYLYLPFAMSVEDLVDIIKSRLPEGTPIPSCEWVRLQFWPTDPTRNTAMKHTGRFDVKFKVQTRQIRGQHEDQSFALHQLGLIKQFCVRWRDEADLWWLDDKAIVPVGEPGLPINTGVRIHNASLVPINGPQLSALDHDFHVCGAIPSVAFRSDVPEVATDSFFRGTAHVTVKDKVFSPSHAIRHGTEMVDLLRSHYSTDSVTVTKPIMVQYTDGGPDHRTTYGSVWLASIGQFISLDLDMFVTARTAPMASWSNLAERVNSTLNLALQNCALDREKMSDEMELKMKGVHSLKNARTLAEKCVTFKDSLVKSIEPVLKLLEGRFGRLKIKGEAVLTHQPATEEDCAQFFDVLRIIDQDLDATKLTHEDLKKSPRLTDWIECHCRARQYIFQIKKCPAELEDNCWYCSMNPPRLPPEEFKELHFVPDPVASADDHKVYASFEEVYGKPTDDNQRPSLSSNTEKNNARDKLHKPLLQGAKVRSFVKCGECKKPRCIYAAAKLSKAEEASLQRLKEEDAYTCGSSLFSPTSKVYDSIVVREGLTCASVMEITFYSGKTATFKDVCFHCGSAADLVEDEPSLNNLKRKYSVVRPICGRCLASGKEPAVRGKNNVSAKKR